MGKPRKNPIPTENPCCVREREQQMRKIRATYQAFPVIREIPCPTCRQWVRLRVYGPEDVEAAT